MQVFCHVCIPFNQLDGGPVRGNAGFISFVVDHFAHTMVDFMGVVVVQIVRLHGEPRMHLAVGHFQQGVQSRAVPGRNGNHRHTQMLGQTLHINMIAGFFHFVHKI